MVVVHLLLKVLLVIVLPFLVLLRGSTHAWREGGLSAWMALLFGALLAAIVLTVYAARVSARVSGRPRFLQMAKWVAVPIVVLYSGYAALHLSQRSAKSAAVRDYYHSLHPVLRVSVGTLILFDRDALITDLRRTPEDYRRMQLPVNPASLHFPQPDGYVHAVDLRTVGRSGLRNLFLSAYFRLIGFDTLRHEGTADHLHVSLPNRAISH